MPHVLKKIIYPIVAFFLLLALWQGAIEITGVEAFLLPGPLDALAALMDVIRSGVLFEHAIASLFRVAMGFLLATVLAVPLGLLMGTRKFLHITLDPILQGIRTISPIAWIPLAILWFGIGDKPAIFIIFITAFFPILLSTALSIRHVDPLLLRVGKNFGATQKQLLFKIILPAVTPYIVIGLKISLGISWIIVVAAEMVGMSSGLGYMILDARNFLRTDLIIAGMFVIGVIGFTLDRLLTLIEVQVKKAFSFQD